MNPSISSSSSETASPLATYFMAMFVPSESIGDGSVATLSSENWVFTGGGVMTDRLGGGIMTGIGGNGIDG